MKKYLLILFVLFSVTAFAQAPQLTWRIADVMILDGTPKKLQFDVEVKCDQPGYYHCLTQVGLFFNDVTAIDVASGPANGWVRQELTDRLLFNVDDFYSYEQSFYNANPNSVALNLAISNSAWGFGTAWAEEIPTTYAKFVQLTFDILDETAVANMEFWVVYMNNGTGPQSYITGPNSLSAFDPNSQYDPHQLLTTYLQYVASGGAWTPSTPDATSGAANATIWSGEVTLAGDAVLNNLTVDLDAEDPAQLNLEGFLTVNGTLTNNAGDAGIVIVDDANAIPNPIRGSLIHNNAGVAATAELDIQGYTNNNNGYHVLGSPVDNMLIEGTEFEPGPLDDLFQWSEPLYLWEEYRGTGFTNFENGRGYLIAVETSGPRDFVGALNVADVSRTVSYTAGEGNGYNLFGNPYASALYWNDANWSLSSNINANTQVWDEAAGNYVVLLPGAVIPKGNGFWVETNAAGNGSSVTIPQAARVNDAQAFYKGADALNVLKIRADGGTNNYKDWVTLRFMEGASSEYDMQYDMSNLEGMSTSPQISLQYSNKSLTLNTLSSEQYSATIPMEFIAGTNGEFTISVETNTLQDRDAFLEDLFTGETVDLQETDSYTFSASTEDDVNRFVITILNALGQQELLSSNTKVHGDADHLDIFFGSKPGESYVVEVIALTGIPVLQTNVVSQPKVTIPVNVKSGIYFIRISNAASSQTFKVIMGGF